MGCIIISACLFYDVAKKSGEKKAQDADLNATIASVKQAANVQNTVDEMPMDEVTQQLKEHFTRDANVSTK